MTPTGLRCAHKIDPLGVAPDRVRFSWLLAGEGQAQTAYQILLTQNDVQVWDSGRLESAATTDIPYGGPPLAAGSSYRWKVQVWDESGLRSAYSSPAVFETELERTSGFHAQWISLGRIREDFRPPSGPGPSDPVLNALLPAPYLRREFRLDQPVTAARLHVTALGLYEARLNGQRVGDTVLAPGWTDYAQRIPYQTYDVTGLLQPGDNVLGVIAADGWACGFFGFDAKRAGRHYAEAPELLAELVLRLADGTEQRVLTDDQWRGAFAAVRHADLLMGERHDLAREPHGWDRPGFDARLWRPVNVRDRDDIPLVADPGPPIRVTEEIAPRSVATDDHGRHVVDFGQNLTGWLRLTVDGPPGAHVRIRHGEVLAADGTLYTDNLRTARAVDEFTTAGGPEVLEPRFTLHGFRYAEITGYPGDIGQADVTARVVHSDIPATGSFASSAPWLDQLWRNIDWGQRGNFISVPTDCPQRDERLGWLADAQIFARTACYNRDVAAFFAKWLDDVADAQYPSGAYPDIAPRLNIPWAGAPAWADGGVIIPWTLHKMYGDTAVLDRHFDGMARWMAYLERTNPGYLRTRELGNSYNDWLAPVEDKTPPELLATAYWAYDAALMTEIAEVTGRAGEAAGFRELSGQLRSAFIDAFVAADGQLASGTQTAYVLGLHMDLIPGDRRAAAAGHLAEAIRREDWHLTTGFAGVGYILPVLCSTGHADVAYRLLEQTSAPSWRHMIDAGATTIWERWDGWTSERGFASAWMNSFNHYALGSVGEWLYRFVLGIDQEPDSAGFRRLLVRPHPGGSLTWARGRYQSARGPIASAWRRDGGRLVFSLDLPPNVTASVRIPSDDPAAVRDQAGAGPATVAGYPGALGAAEAVFAVGPGSHEFAGPALTGLSSLGNGSYAQQGSHGPERQPRGVGAAAGQPAARGRPAGPAEAAGRAGRRADPPAGPPGLAAAGGGGQERRRAGPAEGARRGPDRRPAPAPADLRAAAGRAQDPGLRPRPAGRRPARAAVEGLRARPADRPQPPPGRPPPGPPGGRGRPGPLRRRRRRAPPPGGRAPPGARRGQGHLRPAGDRGARQDGGQERLRHQPPDGVRGRRPGGGAVVRRLRAPGRPLPRRLPPRLPGHLPARGPLPRGRPPAPAPRARPRGPLLPLRQDPRRRRPDTPRRTRDQPAPRAPRRQRHPPRPARALRRPARRPGPVRRPHRLGRHHRPRHRHPHPPPPHRPPRHPRHLRPPGPRRRRPRRLPSPPDHLARTRQSGGDADCDQVLECETVDWVGSGWDFFISYTQADRAWAEWIAWALEEDEHHILVQAWDAMPGASRVQGLRAGTRDATRTIAVLSCDYLTSVYGGAEWHAAWAGDPEGVGRKLLTVRVTDCDGPDPAALLPAGRTDLFGLSEGTAMTRLRLLASAAIADRVRPPVPPGGDGPARAVPTAARFPGKLPPLAGLDRDTAEAIAEQLDRLPLALEQAAAWLDRTRMPSLEYLDLLRRRHAEPIATLWDIGAGRVGAESPAAVQLLSVCAYLASEPVPLDLFTAHAELLPEPLSSSAADPSAFAAVLAVLTGYALATLTPAGLQLHHLVRTAVRNRPAAASPALDPLALALWLLRVDAPAEIHGSPRSWPRWAALIPHVLAATGHVGHPRQARHAGQPATPTALEDTAWLLDRAAAYLHVQGRLPEAKTMHERALILDEVIYGPDHPAVAMRLDALAEILRDLGQLE